MATLLDGETYLGKILKRKVSNSKDVTMYLFPFRCLKSQMGGPTFGIDVGGEEIIRFDAHGPRGHWHEKGYDKLGAGGSHVEFPDNLKEDLPGQVAWSLDQVRTQGARFLQEAGYPEEAASLDVESVKAATEAIAARIADEEADLRAEAIERELITA